MSPELRVLICGLLEKMRQNEEYAGQLGLVNVSVILFPDSEEETDSVNNQEKAHKL